MKKYLSFLEAKSTCKNGEIKTNKDYRKRYTQISDSLPSSPQTVYEEEWQGWSHFLDNKTKYPSYKDTKNLCLKFEIKNSTEYVEFARLKGLPISPNTFYKKIWRGWADFLNNNKKFLTYDEAINKIAKAKDIVGVKTYQKNYRNHKGLPSMPQDIYKDEWNDWYTFLSRDKKSEIFFTYEEALLKNRSELINSIKDYKEKYNLVSSQLPSDPSKVYKNTGWDCWKSFLS